MAQSWWQKLKFVTYTCHCTMLPLNYLFLIGEIILVSTYTTGICIQQQKSLSHICAWQDLSHVTQITAPYSMSTSIIWITTHLHKAMLNEHYRFLVLENLAFMVLVILQRFKGSTDSSNLQFDYVLPQQHVTRLERVGAYLKPCLHFYILFYSISVHSLLEQSYFLNNFYDVRVF